MTPQRWHLVKQILADALELEPELQRAHVAGACGEDQELRAEVESLLEAHHEAGDLMDTPALERDASVVERRAAALMHAGGIGPYRLIEMVGEGGMGSVFKAWREDDPERAAVAVKVVKPGLDGDEILRRFRRERAILGSLAHPHIARLLDSGSTPDGLPYFVMEFIEGRRIDRYCAENALGVEERLRLFQEVCLAVDYAHQHQVLHRDIKPGNVLVTADGTPRLLDFGVGKTLDPQLASVPADVNRTMMRMMTPEYASPEQVMGEPVTAASDIYSLGVVLYELLTGERPYRTAGSSPLALAAAICERDPEPPSTHKREASGEQGAEPRPRGLTPELDDVVLKAMRKRPKQRYASAALLAADIERYLRGQRTRARRSRLWYSAASWLARHKKPVALSAAASLAAAAAILGAALWTRFRPAEQVRLTYPEQVVPFTTFGGDERQPCYSPDGSRMAFVWDGEDGANADIYVKGERSPLRRVTTDEAEDTSPVWSRDGSRIAFLRTVPAFSRPGPGAGGVYVVSAEGGDEQLVAPISFPPAVAAGRAIDWSPDGRVLVLTDRESAEEPLSLYVAVPGDKGRLRLTTPPAGTLGDGSPAFSPDGRRIAFLRSPGPGVADVYVTNLKGGPVRRLTFDNRWVTSLTWMPEGEAIAFASDRTGAMSLWTVPAGGGPPALAPGTGDNISDPAFSRDGRKLAYSRFFRDANVWRVVLGPGHRASGAPVQLIASTVWDSSPQPSPDGGRVAFRSNRSGANEIWTCAAGGEDCAQITRFGGPLTSSPSWSPDGRRLAFDSRPEGRAQIYLVESDGGYPQRIAESEAEDVAPRWSADGRSIYFASNRSGSWQVWKTSADAGGRPFQLTHQGGFSAMEAPGGEYVFYAKGREVAGLWRVPAGGGEEKPVTPKLAASLWSYWTVTRDGVYYLNRPSLRDPWEVLFLEFGTRTPAQVSLLTSPPSLADGGLAVSSDGRFLYFTQVDQSGGDIMVAEYAP